MFAKWKVTSEIIMSCEISEESTQMDIALETEVALNEMGSITLDNGIPVFLRFHFKEVQEGDKE